MSQIHKKFTGEQIKVLFRAYQAGHLSREEIERTLGIGKTRFFALLKHYRADAEGFSIQYQRKSPTRLNAEVEEKIRVELQRERTLVENKELPISSYNYAAMNDRLKKRGVNISTTTLIERAIQQGRYLPKRKKTE